MAVSRQDDLSRIRTARPSPEARGPRARTRKALIASALELMHQGMIPSVSDVAEGAEVSRATAYRYFPSQAALMQDAVLEALGPIIDWTSESGDAEERVDDLLAFSMPRIADYEATHRGALWLAIDQWSKRRAGTLPDGERIVRGSRIRLLREVLEPLRALLDPDTFDKLAKGLSLTFGIEAVVVLKDIWGVDDAGVEETVRWSARALVRQAVAEATAANAAVPHVGAAGKKKRKRTV